MWRTDELYGAGGDMGKKKFRVRLVRPVFQYVDVEVEAGEEREALSAALAGAGTFPAMPGAATSHSVLSGKILKSEINIALHEMKSCNLGRFHWECNFSACPT